MHRRRTGMLNQIISYIEFLKSEYGLSISIHSHMGYLSEYMYKLAPYNIHSNPYCLFLKLNRDIWDICIGRQNSLFSICRDNMFFCTCYAGVGEFVMPILCNHTVVGCISVSGYKQAGDTIPEPLAALAKDHCVNMEELSQAYHRYLAMPPQPSFIQTVITPLCSMFELLCLKDQVLMQKLKSTTSDYIYGHILEYLNLNYASRVKLEDIEKLCHCSSSYISHVFKKRSGYSINGYMNQLRLKEAERLLKQTNLSISEIALMIGYSNSNYFTNLFTKQFHMSPKKYRSQYDK